MSQEIYPAFIFSLAVHTAVIGLCPAPHPNNSGDQGDTQNIVVLGVIQFTPAVENAPETSEARKDSHEFAECSRLSQPAPPVKNAPPEEKIETMVRPDELYLLQPTPLIEPELMSAEKRFSMLQPEDGPPCREEHAKESKRTLAGISPPLENGIPGKQAVTQGQFQTIRSRYLQGVMRKLEEAKQYPPDAYRRGTEGTAKVEFTIRANGRAADIAFLKSSDHPVLDSAAQSMIVRSSPFDPIPVELGQEELAIRVPIAFRIEEVRRGRPHQKGEQPE